MNTGQLVFRCYAKQMRPGTWYAMCVDLNIDAEAETLPGVKASLEDAILGYLETVTETDRHSSLEALLHRPASWRHHVVYGFTKYASTIHRTTTPRRSTFQETIPIRLALSA